jgi:hypothetical protein
MPRPTTEDRLAKVHYRAITEFDRIQSALRDERLQCLQDRRFYSLAGAQWEGPLGEQFENKPKFEVNKVHLAVIRIINEYRNNRITVDFVAKDGNNDDKLSDACNGLFRADEHDSGAEEAYDNAFEEAVGGGFGALRLRTVYEDDEDPDDDRQRIKIEPIYDADSSVFFDLDAKRQDKADAKCCFVLYSMTPEAYELEYNASPASVSKEVEQTEFDWFTPDMVFVAEYYEIDEESDYALTFTSVATGDEIKYKQSELNEDDNIEPELEATGYRETRRKKIKTKRVHKYILSGNKILEDCGLIAGKCIPVVPVYGKRWFVDNIERCMGHVRLAKDAQRLKNMQLSKLAELSALSSTEKPIFNPEQMAGHAQMWSEDNLKNYPYLLVNAITGADGNPMPAGPLSYTKPPQIAPAMAALLQLTEVDMQSILGNQGEADKMVSNISGKAVEMIQTRMDMQTFIYVSNFAKSIRRVGEIWLSMAKDVYVESGRSMKTISSADVAGKVELMRPNADESGAVIYENDLSRAAFDVAVDVGPSSSSRREATVRALTGMMQVSQGDPETMQVLQAMAIMNMEGEGIGGVRDFFRKKLVRMGAVEPTEEEAQMLAAQAQEKTPQDQALEAMAEEAQAKATKARTEVLESIANVELKKAQALETEASMKLKEAQAVAALGKTEGDSTRLAMEMQEKLRSVEQQLAVTEAAPKIPPITVHIHNDGEQTTKIHKIERGPDGEMIAAEIVKGGRNGA